MAREPTHPAHRAPARASSSASSAAASPWLAGLIWVDADPEVRRRRALARDGAAYEPHWDRWSAQEEAYASRERPRERAALVLDASGEVPEVVR